MMNILHIASNYPPYIGGPAASVPYLARELIKKGHCSSVLTKDARGYPDYEIMNGVPTYRTISIQRHHLHPIVAMTKSAVMGLKARSLISKGTIVHAHDMNVSAAAGIIGTKFKGTKKVVKYSSDLVSDILSSGIRKGEPFEDFLRRETREMKLIRSYQDKVFGSYDVIVTPSNYMKKFLLSLSVEEEKIKVVNNGVHVYEYREEKINSHRKELLGDSEHIITCACRMEAPKGIEYLIDAFKDLPKDIKLVMIGEGSLKADLEKRAGGSNILFIGKVPHSEVQAYLRASDIFVLPSLYEPFGISLLDSLAAQTPIIATNVGGTPEIIKDRRTGLLIEPQSKEEIIEGIKKLLADKALCERMRKNQLKAREKFQFKDITEKYIRVYEDMLWQ